MEGNWVNYLEISSDGTMILVTKNLMLPIFLNESSVRASKSAVRPRKQTMLGRAQKGREEGS